jgi:hypothetical protein
MPLVAVVPVAPLVRLKVVPSALRRSAAPFARLLTVSVRLVMVCPPSMVDAAAPLNRETEEPSSVKVGLAPVAVRVGASLTEVTATSITSVAELNAVAPPLAAVLTLVAAVPEVWSHARIVSALAELPL